MSESEWKGRVISGPDVYALHETTYYTYYLSCAIPRDVMRRGFKSRAAGKTAQAIAWDWIDMRRVSAQQWRGEDVDMMQKCMDRRNAAKMLS